MTEDQLGNAPGWLKQLVAFARSSEPRTKLSRRTVRAEIMIAALFAVASAATGIYGGRLGGLAASLLVFAPLAFRRHFPLTAFLLMLVLSLVTRGNPSDLIFLALIFAGYTAAMHSRFRGAALLTLAPAGLLVAVVYWPERQGFVCAPGPVSAPKLGGCYPLAGLQNVAGPVAARLGGLLVLVSLVSIAIVGAVMYTGDRMRRMQLEHEAETRRALDAERARIASELHDVVTHNVSVMIVQAGAARQVLNDSPARATSALLAVEASGRAAMAELRHLLGLLSPAGSAAVQGPADGATLAEQDLRPQPGLQQLQPLIGRVAAAGLPIRLHVSEGRYDLPPGLDLAAFRVVQEAITNVLKHAGEVETFVRLEYGNSALVVDISNGAATSPAQASAIPAGNGRGLIGLRERISLYGGELDSGPRPGGGWRIRARFPVDPVPDCPAADGAATNGAATDSVATDSAAAQSGSALGPLAADAT